MWIKPTLLALQNIWEELKAWKKAKKKQRTENNDKRIREKSNKNIHIETVGGQSASVTET